jgi:hypothetical protein
MKRAFMRSFVASLVLQLALIPAATLAGAAASLDDGDDDDFEFSGVIQSLPSSGLIGDWVVGGRTVHVSSATRIKMEHGPIGVGVFVEVEGSVRTDGSIDAREIETEDRDDDDDEDEFEFSGVIQSLPSPGLIGDWVVAGRTVHVSSSTRIKTEDGPIVVGAFVEVEGTLRPDGSVDAIKIETEDEDDEFKFLGVIQSLPSSGLIGDWVVGGRVVHVSNSTRIKMEHGVVGLGVLVEVKGQLRTDGSVDAREIEVEGPERAEFEGIIQALPSAGLLGDWIVSGRTVHVTGATRIKTRGGLIPAVGMLVEVKGSPRVDGSIDATEIELKKSSRGALKTKFEGTVQQLPPGGLIGVWLVGGRTVHVSSSTRVKQKKRTVIGIGTFVSVKGTVLADGSVAASMIKTK